MPIKTRRWNDPAEPDDGLRLLARAPRAQHEVARYYGAQPQCAMTACAAAVHPFGQLSQGKSAPSEVWYPALQLLPSKQLQDCHEQFGQLTICEHSLVDPTSLQMSPLPPVPEPVPVDPPAPTVVVAPAPPAPVEVVLVVMPGPPAFAAWLQSGGTSHGVPQ
jgi:hypothetical protein